MTDRDLRSLRDANAVRYRIAATAVEVQFGSGPASEVLRRELSLYPETDLPAEVVIRINPPDPRPEVLARNPSTHRIFEDGFAADFGRYSVSWRRSDVLLVDMLDYDEARRSLARKFVNIDFAHPFEDIGRIFHEIVLVPTVFMHFHARCAIVHGSAVRSPEGRGILVTGTGGVGKTSLMLGLVRERGWRFMSDDIAFVGADGRLWLNGAYPKIYAYNAIGDGSLGAAVMAGRSVADKLQWSIRQRMGRSRVRRRMDPRKLGTAGVAPNAPLERVYVICRRARSSIGMEEIAPAAAVEMSMSLIQAEYGVIVNHLHWQQFNAGVLGQQPAPALESILGGMRSTLQCALGGAQCFLLNVPLDDSARQLQDGFLSLSGF
jgi:hypothetical protein